MYDPDIAWIRGNEGSFEDIMKLLELNFDTSTDHASIGQWDYSDMNELRRLVSYFVLYKYYEIKEYEAFRQLVLQNGQIGLTLFYASQDIFERLKLNK